MVLLCGDTHVKAFVNAVTQQHTYIAMRNASGPRAILAQVSNYSLQIELQCRCQLR